MLVGGSRRYAKLHDANVVHLILCRALPFGDRIWERPASEGEGRTIHPHLFLPFMSSRDLHVVFLLSTSYTVHT